MAEREKKNFQRGLITKDIVNYSKELDFFFPDPNKAELFW